MWSGLIQLSSRSNSDSIVFVVSGDSICRGVSGYWSEVSESLRLRLLLLPKDVKIRAKVAY